MAAPTITLFSLPQGLRDRIYDGYFESSRITGVQAVIALLPVFAANKQLRYELLDRVKHSLTIHPLNSSSYKNAMNAKLAGVPMRNHGLKATFLYYENGGDPVELLRFLSSLAWRRKADAKTKEKVIQWFKVRTPGPVSKVVMTHKGPLRFRIEGSSWWFEVSFVEADLNSYGVRPRTYAAFTGHLGKLSFLMEACGEPA